jgi:hypothetical protein
MQIDGKVWIGGDSEYQVDIKTGKWTTVDYLKGQPPARRITVLTAWRRTRRTTSTAWS